MSRRKQQNPKSIKGGGDSQNADTVLASDPTQSTYAEVDFDAGYRPLVISSDDVTDISKSLNNNQKLFASVGAFSGSLAYGADSLKQPPSFDVNTAARVADSLSSAAQGLDAPESGSGSESDQYPPVTSSSLLGRSDSVNVMTLGGMDYGSDDSQDCAGAGGGGSGGGGGVGKPLVISPAIYRGQNTPIPRPRQPTPSKTRRKSDKIVPVVTPEGQKFICPVCKLSLSSNNELTSHIRSHNSASAVNTCTICGKVLSSQSSLDRHMLVHSGERPFRCKVCDMTFTTNGNMHRHARIHTKEGAMTSQAASTGVASHQSQEHTEGKRRRVRPQMQLMPTSMFQEGKRRRVRPQMQLMPTSMFQEGKRRRVRPQMQLMPTSMQQTPPTGGVKRKHDLIDDTLATATSTALIQNTVRMHSAALLQDTALIHDTYQQDVAHAVQQPVIQTMTTDSEGADTDTLTCPICLKTFMCKYGLDTHFESQHGADAPAAAAGAQVHCQLCQLSLPSNKLVYVHYFMKHVDRSKLSEFVSQPAPPTSGLMPLVQGFHDLSFTDFSIEKFAHIAKVWCEKNKRRSNSVFHDYHCRRCDHAFPSADVLRMHLETHPEVCDVTCQVCDVTFGSKQEFEDHVTQHSGEKVVETVATLVAAVGHDDVQALVSQPEFLLCLGLKSTRSSSDWCNNNAIERDARKYESQIGGAAAAATSAKPVNHVQPIVIEPKADHVLNVTRPGIGMKHKLQKVANTHPAFPQSSLYNSLLPRQAARAPVAKESVEISSSSDGEGEGDRQNADNVRPYQCVICEFTFSSLSVCETHCRCEHQLTSVNELHSAVKVNPLSGQGRLNPLLSLSPYLCKACTNGFTSHKNVERHVRHQHGAQKHRVSQYIATNKRLQPGGATLQPSYLAGMQDAKQMVAKNVQQLLERHQAKQQQQQQSRQQLRQQQQQEPEVERSAFSAATPSHPPVYCGSSGVYITSPPVAPPPVASVKQEAGDVTEMPLDFSIKKEEAHDLSSKPSPARHALHVTDAADDADAPMDLSVKPLTRDGSSMHDARVALSSPSSSSSSSPLQFLSSMSSALQPLSVRAHASDVGGASRSHGDGAAAANANTHPTKPPTPSLTDSTASPFVAPTPPPRALNPLHANLQHCYVAALGKFQCPLCCLLFKNTYQLQNHVSQQHSATSPRPLYRCKHCPATCISKADIERHILCVHPQTSTPPDATNPLDPLHPQHLSPVHQRTSSSTPSAPSTPTHDVIASYGSDSDLSSINKMLDCASQFRPFFPAPGATDIEPGEVRPSTGVRYMRPKLENIAGLESSPLHVLQQAFGRRSDEALTDGSVSTARSDTPSLSPATDDSPGKRKRNSYSDSPHRLQCPYCPRAFPWVSSLKRHILTHTGQKPFKCPECPVTFSTKSNRERHMVRKHGLDIQDPVTRASMERPYKCHNCDETFTSAGFTKDHYADAHPGVTVPDYVTQQAGFEQLSEPGATERHNDGQSDISDVPSSVVDDFDEDDEELDAERMKRATTSAVTLALSPSPTPTPAITSSPAAAATDSCLSAYPASETAPEYLTKINPERDNYNVDRITGCWKCGQQFDSRKMLLRHLKDHNIDFSYKCYLCDASFESRSVCLRHTQDVHRHDWALLRDKNKCYDIDGYSGGIELQVHETLANLGLNDMGDVTAGLSRTATATTSAGTATDVSDDKNNPDSDYAQRKVFCSFCVKRFWSLQDLRRHMRSHTGERPFECDICQKRFTLKHSMMRHRRKHTATELADASALHRSISPGGVSDDDTLMPHADVTGMSALAHADGESINNNVKHLPPVDDVAARAQLAAMMTSQPSLAAEIFANSGVLHNLLGVNNSQLDQILQTKATDAAKLLGVGDK